MNKSFWFMMVSLVLTNAMTSNPARADGKSAAAREAAEFVISRFGKDAAEQGIDTFARKIEILAAKHGDEAISAVKRTGPKAIRLVEQAGEHGGNTVKLLSRHGEEAVVWVVERPKGMAIFIKYGDRGAEALIKHKGIAEPVLEGLGEPALCALEAVNGQNGIRIARMFQEGDFAKIGKTSDLLKIVGVGGNQAMDFVWRHKGSLVVTTALAAFLADPKPFIEGTKDITKIIADDTLLPLAGVPGQVATESVKATNWTVVACLSVVVTGTIVAGKLWLRHRTYKAVVRSPMPSTPNSQTSAVGHHMEIPNR